MEIGMNIIQIILTIIAVAVIGGMKFYERKYGNNPEAWDMQKFGLFMVVAVVVMFVEYAYGNAIVFPAEEIIVPATALFGMVITLLTAGKLANQTVVPKIIGKPLGASGWKPGYSVVPTFSKGVSPFAVKFTVTAGVPADDHPGVTHVEIDWMDGTPKDMFTMHATGVLEPSHVFAYDKGTSKYTGHEFYPAFKFIMNNGEFFEFNVDGKAVAIEVQSV